MIDWYLTHLGVPGFLDVVTGGVILWTIISIEHCLIEDWFIFNQYRPAWIATWSVLVGYSAYLWVITLLLFIHNL